MKPSVRALACAREIEALEPHHKYAETRIVDKAVIIDRHYPPATGVNTDDEVRDTRNPQRNARNSEDPK